MRWLFSLSLMSLILAGCATDVPGLNWIPETQNQSDALIGALANHIRCEMENAVGEVAVEQRSAAWLKTWSAKVSLGITIDEKATLSPGIAVTRLLPSDVHKFANGTTLNTPQSSAFGFGGSVSSDAQRVLTITWFLLFDDLVKAYDLHHSSGSAADCRTGHSYLEGDLKVKEGLSAGVNTATTIRTVSDPFRDGGPLQVIEHHVTFEVDASGNFTPSWKLVNVSANTTGTLLSGNRNRKDDLIITMGPTALEDTTKRKLRSPTRVPSVAVENAHLAAQIGQSVRNAIQSFQP